jgi:hypothetical protein
MLLSRPRAYCFAKTDQKRINARKLIGTGVLEDIQMRKMSA